MGKRSELKAYLNSRSNARVSPPQDKNCHAVPVHQLDEATISSLEEEHVFNVYEKIATHFGKTRYKMWPEVSRFLDSLPDFSLVLDAGCGNGKNLSPPNGDKLMMIGSDRALAFCKLANESTGKDCFRSDIGRDTGISFRESSFDAAISIAVIHHIPSLSGRIAALSQIARCLRPGGRALIYVWAMDQDQSCVGARTFESKDVYVPWHFQTRYSEGGEGDKSLEQMQRYYHVFTESEFRDLLNRVSPLLRVVRVYFDNNNWSAELVRTDLPWSKYISSGWRDWFNSESWKIGLALAALLIAVKLAHR
jgi:alkylated DNA repair protein alkB homolog 8